MIRPCFKEETFDYLVKQELHCTLFTLADSLTTEEQFEGKETNVPGNSDWRRILRTFQDKRARKLRKSLVKYYLELCKMTESRKSER